MIVARWMIDARFGHKDDAVGLIKYWRSEIGPQAGLDSSKHRVMVTSIGSSEATIVSEIELDSLTALDDVFSKLGKLDAHAKWSVKLEPHIVSGTNRWEILRVL